MYGMFGDASSFNQELNAWDVSSVTDMFSMFAYASSFNQDLCPWGKIPTFPYDNVGDMFYGSGCTYQNDPGRTNKGPFCASDCIASVSPSVIQSPSSSQKPFYESFIKPESIHKSKPFFESITEPGSIINQSPTRYATCGSGSVGNGLCPNPNACCSNWGWCGYGVDYCGYWDNDNLYSNSNESQNENIANETTFSSVSEPEIATYELAGALMSSSSTSATPTDKPKKSRSLAAFKPPKQICWYAGNKKCPNVPQKSTASSCSCK
jgi:surface protein